MHPTTKEPSYFASSEAHKRFREILASAEGRGLTREEWIALYELLSEHGRAVIIEILRSPEPEKIAASEASKHRAAAPRPIRASKQPSEEREGSELDEHLSRV